MTPADLAKHSAISFEAKKDSLRQMQNGDWKVSFTVQAVDMDKRLTMALPGARYMAVLVEVGADELPVHQPAKDSKTPPVKDPATPSQGLDKPLEKASRMDWRELQPAAQAGIRCDDPIFVAFLRERHRKEMYDSFDNASVCVRTMCGVTSRADLGSNHKARVIWKQLDDQFQAWQRVGA